jgi:uncharacterized protein (DUF433 family)
LRLLALFSDRITIDPKILCGKPVIKGTRIPISIILGMIRDGSNFDQIIAEYPRLTEDDIKAALDYSIYAIENPDEDIIISV